MSRASFLWLVAALLAPTGAMAQRALEEGVILRLGVGYEFVGTDNSGEPALQGHVPELRTTTQFLDADLALGTRGLGWRHLNSYALGTFVMDLQGPADDDELLAHGSAYHGFDGARAFLLHLAYAEIEGFTDAGAAARMHLRGGRQFHWGMVAVTFDGGTFGYDDGQLAAAVRFGRRSAVFDTTQDDPGLVGGATFAYDFGKGDGLLLRGEYIFFAREIELSAADRQYVKDVRAVDETIHAAELAAYYDITRDFLIQGRVDFVAPEVSHARAGIRWSFDTSTLFIDFDQKIGRDLFYDLAGGRGFERNDRRATYESLRLNIPDRQPYSDVRALLSWELAEAFALEPSIGGRKSYGEEAELSAYDADRLSWGLGAFSGLRIDKVSGLEIEGRYDGHYYGRADNGEGHFFDTAAGAEVLAHELSAGLRYTRGSRFVGNRILGNRVFTAGVSGFLEAFTLDNRYIEALDESLVGARLEADWAFSTYASVRAAYEFAKDSTVFARFVEPFHGVRVRVEGRL